MPLSLRVSDTELLWAQQVCVRPTLKGSPREAVGAFLLGRMALEPEVGWVGLALASGPPFPSSLKTAHQTIQHAQPAYPLPQPVFPSLRKRRSKDCGSLAGVWQSCPWALLLAASTLDDPIGLLDGRLVHEHGVLCVAGLQHILFLVLVGCGHTESQMGEKASPNEEGLREPCL